jgi:tungstate transport system substrate-binding protein
MTRTVLFSMLLATLVAAAALAQRAGAEQPFIVLQSTTSTENSGLLRHILPIFEEQTGIKVRVVAVGTGQALKNAERGDGDVVLVHDKAAEEKFVAAGFGVKRLDVMFNDYVLVGPKDDPAGIAGMKDAAEALRRIAVVRVPFASRGDESGTHKAELALWRAARVDVAAASGDWYRATGSGMGPTLNTAAGMGAYALTDRGTWISFRNRGPLQVVVEGDERLFNQYGVILVNPARHPTVKATEGQTFIDWLAGPEGQSAIRDFRIEGQQLFFPNAAVAELRTAD